MSKPGQAPASSNFSFQNFFDKIKDPDPDLRHMALYDLSTELQKDRFTLDDNTQRHVMEAIISKLEETNNDVQGMAVKCLPYLVSKVKETYVEKLLQTLCKQCLEGDKKDVAGIALKTVVLVIPADFSGCIKRQTAPLIQGLEKAANKVEVLDVLNDIVKKFGAIISEEHERLQKALVQEIASENVPTRKKAIICLASLCVHSSDALFGTVVDIILQGIKQTNHESLRKYIQLCSAVSRSAGNRLGRHLASIVPILVKHIDDEGFADDEGSEVLENIVQAFESFVLRCPQPVSAFFDDIVSVCKRMLCWDPNYTYGDDDAMEVDDDADDGDMEDLDADEEDDDVSWKVRKAAAKCLSAFITTRPDLLDQLYQRLCSEQEPLLPERFKEREESVKLDVFHCFSDLISQSRVPNQLRAEDDLTSSLSLTGSFYLKSVRVRNEVKYLIQVKSKIIRGLLKCLQEKSMKIKVGCIIILKELAPILGDNLRDDVPSLVAAVKPILQDRGNNSALVTETLQFIRYLMTYNSQAFQPFAGSLCEPIFACVNDKYYKITAEALRVCGELVKVLRALPEADAKIKTKQLYDCVYKRLSIQDIDQDVKESAIHTMGKVLAQSSSFLPSEALEESQKLLLQLLRNELAQIVTIKTLSVTKDVPMSKEMLQAILEQLCSFLRKSSRPLRQATLVTLRDLVTSQKPDGCEALLGKILEELAPMFTDQDLHLSYLALELSSAILQICPQVVKIFEERVLDNVITLLKSPLLQGHALEGALQLFSVLVEHSTAGFNQLLTKVLRAAETVQNKQVYTAVSQVVATIVVNTTEQNRKATIEKFCGQLKSTNTHEVILALYYLGEIGKNCDMPAFGQIVPVMRALFSNEDEEVKTIAASSLGRLSAGNLQAYLPEILKEIASDPSKRYLSLRCLREAIAVSSQAIGQFLPTILPLLFEHSQSEEDGIRNVVAECIGKLALMEPKTVLDQLLENIRPDANQLKKATIISGLKYTITEQPQPIDEYLTQHLDKFLASALDKRESVKIRRAGVLLFTAAAHHKPNLVRANLDKFMPALYAETPIDKLLIREVNLGPFKHKLDDGLELRKAVFECMDILLDNNSNSSLLEFLNDYPRFINHVQYGLKDDNTDIRMLAHLMVCKLCKIPNAVLPLLNELDEMSENLTQTVTRKLKPNTVQKEKERHDDLIKTTIRAIIAISQLNGALDNAKFALLFNQTLHNDKEVEALLNSVLKENEQQTRQE